MSAYSFTTILSSDQFSGYDLLKGFNNQNQILFSFGDVYANGTMTEIIGPSGEFDTSGVAINNSGEVLAADDGAGGNNPYFVENVGGSPTAVNPALPPNTPDPPSGYSNFVQDYALNDSGTIVGEFQDDGGNFLFLYSPNSTYATFLADPFTDPGILISATSLNNSNEFVGTYQSAGNPYNGFLYNPANGGTWTTIDDPAAGVGGSTLLNKINNAGQILGDFEASGGGSGAFLDSGGQFVTLSDPLATGGTTATWLNNSGVVVGYYVDSSSVYHGFVYANGVYTTVDDPLVGSKANQGTLLDAINDGGELVGQYYDSTGVPHYFLAGIPPVTVTVETASGLDMRWATLYNETVNSPIGAGGTSTQYICIDDGEFNGQSAPIKFVVSGTGFTYSGSFPNIQLIGGTITGVQEEDTSGNVLATITGLSLSATTLQAAMASYVASGGTNPTALNAVYLALAYNVTGGAGSDKLQGGNLNDTIFGSGGNDTIDGGGGTNTADYSSLTTPGLFAIIQGGAGTVNKGGANGSDTLTNAQDIVDNGTGRGNGDVFEIDSGENVTASSSDFNYLIELSTGVSLAYGTNFTGISEFISNTGTNTVSFATDTSFAYLYGSTGNDTLTLGSGGGYLIGEGGTNVLTGGTSATNLFIGGQGGTDTMNGGAGTASNYYFVDNSDQVNGAGAFNAMIELVSGVSVQLGSAQYAHVQEFVANSGVNAVTVASTDSDFTYLYGGAGNDTLTTGSGGGYLFGEGGTNVLTGGGGTDVFVADGASGVDTMNGGTGSNIYFIDSHSAVHGAGTFNTVIELQQGVSLALGSAQLGTDVQEVVLNTGTNTADFHTATSAVFLYGSSGNDTLFGGAGSDFLYGGGGTNTFTFGTGWGKDTIMDWTTGTSNLIDLTALAGSGVHAVTDLTQTITGGHDVITSSHTGTNSITLLGVGAALTAGSFHFA